MGWLSMKKYCCLKSTTPLSQCSTKKNCYIVQRESRLMQYSCLRTALHGPIQAVIMMKELRFNMLSVIKKSVLFRRISWMGFETFLHWHVQPIYPNSPFPQEPSKPIQTWKPLFYSRFPQLDPKQLHKSSQLWWITQTKMYLVLQENVKIHQHMTLLLKSNSLFCFDVFVLI